MNTPNFSDIYTLYFEDVYKYLLALCHDEELAEELAQDTFFKAMKSYENFRGDCKITTWLCQIAKHSFFLYEKHRKRNIDLNSVENEIVDTNSIEILLGQREQAFGIHKLLHNLPEPYNFSRRPGIPRQRGGRGCSPAFHRRAASRGAFHPDFHYAMALPAKDSCGRSPYPASANCGRWGQRHCTGHSCSLAGQ